MTGLAQFFEYNSQNFVNGQARVLYSQLSNGALTDQAVPADLSAIFGMVSPYDPLATSGYSPWVDIGGTQAAPEDGRDVALTEWKIQQLLVAVELIPNEVVHTVKISAMEVARADLLGIFENGPAENVISSGANKSAQEQQYFGQFTNLNQYRVAIVACMPLSAGVVTEPTGATRPRFFGKVFNRCTIAAENVSLTWEIAQPLHCDISLRCYIEPGAEQNEEYGAYYIESAGTIAS
jgi:hypothetical protein